MRDPDLRAGGDPQPHPRRDAPRRGGASALLRDALIAALLVALVHAYVARVYQVPTGSMTPTLSPGDRIVVDLVSPRARDPRPGDVVVADLDGRAIAKRVAGVAGQRVAVAADGAVTADGRLVAHPADRARPAGEWTVPDGAVFLLGDALDASVDSRHHGSVPVDDVVGRVVVVAWPPSRAGPPQRASSDLDGAAAPHRDR